MKNVITHLWLVYIVVMKVESFDYPIKIILDTPNNVNVKVFNIIHNKINQNHLQSKPHVTVAVNLIGKM